MLNNTKLVMCGDCKHYDKEYCPIWLSRTHKNFGCFFGELNNTVKTPYPEPKNLICIIEDWKGTEKSVE